MNTTIPMMPHISASIDRHIPSSPATIVCIGDSITHGDTGLGYHASHPWPSTVGTLLGANVVSCGHDGASTVDYRTYPEWQTAIDALPQADLVVIGLGTNDVDLEHARDEQTVAEVIPRYEHLVADVLRHTEQHPSIAVLSVLQFATEEPIFRERFDLATIEVMNHGVDLLNMAYRRMCRRNGWHFIDYAANLNQRRELYGNSIHPNQQGYDVMAHLLASRFAMLLGA